MTLRDSFRALQEISTHPLNTHRRTGAIFDYFRWNIGRRLLATDQIIPLTDGASVLVSDKENFGTLAFTCAFWDFQEMLFLTHLLRPGDLFLDIGANVGVYTILASAVTGARAMAFEPIDTTFRRLSRNIRLNDIAALAHAHQIALSDQETTLRMTADQGGLNHVVSADYPGATLEVPVRRLDDVLGGEACRLIKLDTEGFDLPVLRGGPRALANPGLMAMIVELNGSGDRYGYSDGDVHAEILRHGFAPFHYEPGARKLSPAATFNKDSLNTLYVRDVDKVRAIVAEAGKVKVRGIEF